MMWTDVPMKLTWTEMDILHGQDAITGLEMDPLKTKISKLV